MLGTVDHRPRPGTVVEFDPVATGTPRRHGVPASCFQTGHFRLAAENRSRGAVHSPWVAFSFDLPERADLDALAAAWSDFTSRHEALRSWYEPGPGDGFTGWVHEPGTVQMKIRDVGDFGTAEELGAHLNRRFDEATDPHRWPGPLFCAVLRPSSTTCYFAVDHAYSDGYSVAALFEEVRALYRQHRGGPAARLRRVDGCLSVNAWEARTLAELTPKALAEPRWEPWRAFFRGSGLSDFPADVGNPRQELLPAVCQELPLLDAGEASAFRDFCRARGGGFAAGLFAGLAVVQREVTGEGLYRVLTSVSTRFEPRRIATQGWLINLAPVVFDVSDGAGLSEAVRRAQVAFEEARRLVDCPVHRAVELMADAGAVDPGQMRIPPMVSYLDGRATPGADAYEEAAATMYTGPDNAIGVSLWVSWFRSGVSVVVRSPGTPQAARSVPAHLERLGGCLRTALRRG